MSLSTQLLHNIPDGTTLVAITEIKQRDSGVLVRFSCGDNNSHDNLYDFTTKEFFKMCADAQTMEENYLIHHEESIGKSLWITIEDSKLVGTEAYQDGTSEPSKEERLAKCREIIEKANKDPMDIM